MIVSIRQPTFRCIVVPVEHDGEVFFHPWRRLRSMPQIDVAWPVLAVELGRTDGLTRIEIDRRLGQAARRCVLTHELVHVDMGHSCRQPRRIERWVRSRTAQLLLPLPLIATAAAFTTDLDYMALDCWVTRDVLDDRLETLTDAERAAVMDATAHHRDTA